MKIVMLRLEIEDTELEQAHIEYTKERGKPAPSDLSAVAHDIQRFCYDDGLMHGSFQVLSVEPA